MDSEIKGDTASPEVLDWEPFMRIALEEAALAADSGEVPVGAVAVGAGGELLARGHNLRESNNDPTAHAELLVISEAARRLGSWRCAGVTVVSTLEPCPMCAGALVAARAARVVFGATDPKAGACGTLYNLCSDPRLNHELEVVAGVLAGSAAELLERFFATLRTGR